MFIRHGLLSKQFCVPTGIYCVPGTVPGQGVEAGRPGPLLSGAYILFGKIINTYER